MSQVIFQGRGPLYLQEINSDGTLKAAFAICPDSIALDMAVEGEWKHINRCGPVDVQDAAGDGGLSAGLTLSFANVEDKLFAFGALGTVNVAASPGSVSGELGPPGLLAGDFYFLGGKTRHRAITSLVATDTGNSPASALTVTTNYTLDAASGLYTAVTNHVGEPSFNYGYTDPQYVTILNAPVKNYFASYEFMNRQAANDAGSLELYKVRFPPASTMDFMSSAAQSMSLKGAALADITRASDGALGQFGRRIL